MGARQAVDPMMDETGGIKQSLLVLGFAVTADPMEARKTIDPMIDEAGRVESSGLRYSASRSLQIQWRQEWLLIP